MRGLVFDIHTQMIDDRSDTLLLNGTGSCVRLIGQGDSDLLLCPPVNMPAARKYVAGALRNVESTRVHERFSHNGNPASLGFGPHGDHRGVLAQAWLVGQGAVHDKVILQQHSRRTSGGQGMTVWGWSRNCQLTPEKRVIEFQVLC